MSMLESMLDLLPDMQDEKAPNQPVSSSSSSPSPSQLLVGMVLIMSAVLRMRLDVCYAGLSASVPCLPGLAVCFSMAYETMHRLEIVIRVKW
jgi:hypothetical protein